MAHVPMRREGQPRATLPAVRTQGTDVRGFAALTGGDPRAFGATRHKAG
jgi:hypothetical protein